MSETSLDSSILFDDDNLEISGSDLIRAGRPFNSKQGGVCVYYKNSLSLKSLDIRYLKKTCKIVTMYRLPSQSKGDFETLKVS